ncbi:MAG: hypothetical protein HY516_01590 [Candidatus Aenigmarchaeota archaeon]|nr:hypothetical protein [Candidatus Aenigmarchaeota archaeon]
MDSVGRLKQLLENGIRLHGGSGGYEHADRELLGIFPDGAKEYVNHGSPIKNTHKDGDMYSRMIDILKKEGIDIEKLPIKSQIHIDVHTLEMVDGKTYHFYTPSRSYLRNKQ